MIFKPLVVYFGYTNHMESIQEMPVENQINKEEVASTTDKRIADLLDGPPSENYMRRQMQLAVEKHSVEHPEEPLDHDILSKIIMDWAESDWSRAFSAMTKQENFKTHARFAGNVANVTFEDVKIWFEKKILPEK